ncbi:MAG: DUF885 domain-containing protein [Erysipelotrichaceae bacterium]|nr:DUF885 domain-containing protein [Erysipelotrichaceae bacterium]
MRKKKIICLVSLSLSLLFTGCKQKPDDQARFDQYLDSLPTRFISNTNMNLEYLFENPTLYGFQDELLTLPFSTKEDYEQSKKESENILKELDQFHYDSLSEKQKLTYDILKDNLERGMKLSNFYDLDNNYLGSFIGFQAQLPMLLNEYTFERKHDLDSYFHILETSEETFLKYAENEKYRQEQGTGMSQTILDKVIQQCENFVNSDLSFLIDRINGRIDQVSFLSDDEKEAAKTRNRETVNNQLKQAYRSLKEQLQTIDASKEDLGLASKPNGKEYYENLLQVKTGVDMDVAKLRTYLERKITDLEMQLLAIVRKDASALENLNNGLTFTDLTSVEEVLDYLKEAMKKDYPTIDNLSYEITKVPEALADNFSPAAYLMGKIDAPISAPEHIYINGDFSHDLFSTIAHEGYPGHMYQHTYFKQQQYPTVRYLLDYNGYSEGWATYVERNSIVEYTPKEYRNSFQLSRINNELVSAYISLSDIGIHYDGWNRDDFTAYIEEVFGEGVLTEEELKEQYDLILETPTNYLQYYVTAFQFQDLHDKASKALGSNFSNIDFHEVILKTGPAPFHILEKEVDKYITK